MNEKDHDALRDALAEAMIAVTIDGDWPLNIRDEYLPEFARQLLAHHAVLAALAGSGPEAGLDVERLATAVLHIHGFGPGEELTTEDRAWAGSLAAEYLRLAATPTASPTDTGVEHSVCECGLAESYHDGRLRPVEEYRPRYPAATPTATGERS